VVGNDRPNIDANASLCCYGCYTFIRSLCDLGQQGLVFPRLLIVAIKGCSLTESVKVERGCYGGTFTDDFLSRTELEILGRCHQTGGGEAVSGSDVGTGQAESR